MSYKRGGGGRRVDRYDPKVVWKKLPHPFKTFDGWYYTSGRNGEGSAAGLRDWCEGVGEWLREEFGPNDPKAPSAVQVGAVGGLTFAAWYEHMLRSFPPGSRRLIPVD